MAKILKNFKRKGKGGRPTEYPWDDWFDGQTRLITRGEDFKTTLHAMEVLIRRTATKRGVKVSLSLEPETESIVIEFVGTLSPDSPAQEAESKTECATAVTSARPRRRIAKAS